MPLEKSLEPAAPGLAWLALPEPSPHIPASLPIRSVCRIVRQMVSELILLLGDRVMLRRDRRRYACQVRQIAMYVCHVALRISLSDIGAAMGRDRSTVSHACHVVEDRRDDSAFDDFVAAVERLVTAAFGVSEMSVHD
ncbi:transposase [Rhizobium sp. XQZ8]|uniref:helix-turn-helix domain-containing protein n=1 Tax=Rhizobium populisoli TaxID=2859785 RepID=UPI000470ABF2|nr:helix-turn-helix domain-containing protein [Rhizobium populisoli]MBW6421219.1 transposase [Rhizobium populisoli]